MHNTDRSIDMAARRLRGESLAQIGEAYDISRSRVQQILSQVQEASTGLLPLPINEIVSLDTPIGRILPKRYAKQILRARVVTLKDFATRVRSDLLVERSDGSYQLGSQRGTLHGIGPTTVQRLLDYLDAVGFDWREFIARKNPLAGSK